MKVFKIHHYPEPASGRFKSFAGISLKEADTYVFKYIGNGRPYFGEWRPIEVYIPNPRLPHPKIFGGPGGFIVGESTFEILAEPLERCTEALPISIEGKNEKFFICHILTAMNAVDRERSDWMDIGGKRMPKMLTRPSFIAERLGDESLFKIPDDYYVGNFCLERTGDPSDGEFKALVEHHGLTGLGFTEVWSA